LVLNAPSPCSLLLSFENAACLIIDFYQHFQRFSVNLSGYQTIFFYLLVIEEASVTFLVLNLLNFPDVILIPNSLMDGVEVEITEQLQAIVESDQNLLIKYADHLKLNDILSFELIVLGAGVV
jgi:hypothetical protein